MFERFYQLRENPFSTSPDPRYLFAGATHREAVSGLVYAIIERKGFAVLTGEAGTGKTTILRVVAEALPKDRVRFTYLFNPRLSPRELLEHIQLDLGAGEPPSSKARQLLQLAEFFSEHQGQGRTCALIVDEAHKLSPETLEEIRLLTNFETCREKMLQIVLAGQPELTHLLDRPDLWQLKQRIALRVGVSALGAVEVERYVRHRWLRAGGIGEPPFTPEAYTELWASSRGIPRLINVLCNNSLMLVLADDQRTVGPNRIREAAGDLEWAPEAEGPHPKQLKLVPVHSGDSPADMADGLSAGIATGVPSGSRPDGGIATAAETASGSFARRSG